MFAPNVVQWVEFGMHVNWFVEKKIVNVFKQKQSCSQCVGRGERKGVDNFWKWIQVTIFPKSGDSVAQYSND